MPSLAAQLARGRGKYRARIVIEGWPHIFVVDSSLVRTLSDGRAQVVGLDPRSIRIAASASLAFAQLREQEMTIEIADVAPAYKATESFARAPTAVTDLAADLTVSATTVTVYDTADFPQAGVIHIRGEAIAYTSKTSTTFTGCTRGYWQTTAQAHFVGDGDRLQFPEVTSLPTSLLGRRVLIYLYGSGDDSAGDGTLRWRGIARSDLEYQQGVWRFSVEPRSRILEQQLGGDLEEPVPIRGIYLPGVGALRFAVTRWTGPRLGGSSSDITTDQVEVVHSGFWADNGALCADINTTLTSGTSGWSWGAGASLVAEPRGSRGWRLVYRTATTGTVHHVGVSGWTTPDGRPGVSPVDYFENASDVFGQWIGPDGTPTATLLNATAYTMDIDAPVPRAWGGRSLVGFRDPGGAANVQGRIYLGGTFVPTADMVSLTEIPEQPWSRVAEYDATDRWIRFSVFGYQAYGPDTRFKFLRVLAEDAHVGDLLVELQTSSPGLANTGAMPLLTGDDFSTDHSELEDAIADLQIGAGRTYVATGGYSLGELLEQELRLVGCYLAVTASGQLVIRRLGLGLTTDVVTTIIDAKKIKGSWPATSKNAEGQLSEVIIRQGWDPIEDEYRGLSIRVRSVSRVGATSGVLEVKPRSRVGGFVYSETDPVEVQPEEASALAQGVLGLFGGPYSTITLEVGAELLDVEIGQSVLLTTPHVPGADGTRGIAQKVCRVIGYDWSPFEGTGTLTLLTHDRRIAGYTPAFLVSSQTNVSGNRWLLNLTTAAYSGSGADAWFAVGDEVRVIQRNTRTPTRVSGTVFTAGASALVVDFDGTWTPGSSSWSIGYDRSPSVDTLPPSGRRWAQTAFVFVAGTTQRISLASGSVRAYEWSP